MPNQARTAWLSRTIYASVFLAFAMPLGAQRGESVSQQSVQVFTEIVGVHKREQPRLYWSPKVEHVRSRIFVKGSGWAIEHERRLMIVTALHVVGLSSRPFPIGVQTIHNGEIVNPNPPYSPDEITEQYLGAMITIGVGDRALAPSRIGTIDGLADIAILDFGDMDLRGEVQPTPLSRRQPSVGDSVTVIGFPGTFTQQRKASTISSLLDRQNYFVLNESLENGYSGGLVLDRQNRAVGVVSSVTNRQTTVYRLGPGDLSRIVWRNASDILEENPQEFSKVAER